MKQKYTTRGASLQDRIMESIVVVEDCWEWIGHCSAPGYGQMKLGGRMVKAHRASYEAFVGPIPPGLEIDHLCRNPRCVKPSHLEAVDHFTNMTRGENPISRHHHSTHCKHGHEFTPENTIISLGKNGRLRRQCHACYRIIDRARGRLRGNARKA